MGLGLDGVRFHGVTMKGFCVEMKLSRATRTLCSRHLERVFVCKCGEIVGISWWRDAAVIRIADGREASNIPQYGFWE